MDLVGSSEVIRTIKQLINQVAKTNANVLILGESGTGKELVAKNIHIKSNRVKHNFVAVNCAALPIELLESELFGYEKGAFTGALINKKGRFEIADEGTIFLDEIGDMPLNMQVKILRVIQEQAFERVGGVKTIHTNARIISATNCDLAVAVKEKKFREDLFYRLNVFPINIAPLRERKNDIIELIEYYKNQLQNNNIEPCVIKANVIDSLLEYSWPGNIRELFNLIEHLSILYPGMVIQKEHLPDKITKDVNKIDNNKLQKFDLTIWKKNILDDNFDLKKYLDTLEKNIIKEALERSNYVTSKAAILLKIKRTTLIEKMKKLDLMPLKSVSQKSDNLD